MVKNIFPGAINNLEFEKEVVNIQSTKGYTGQNTLLATSPCCDELARRLEDDFVKIYGNNFNLGGLSGFPFAGNTGFGAMAAHIPDDGYCLVIYGPHLSGIKEGGAQITTKVQNYSDFQQGAVQELILPHGKRLADANDRMRELPYALFDSQDLLVQDIVQTGAGGTKKGLALLGGVQINTGPGTLDYFHPLSFDYMNNKGELVEDLLPRLEYEETGAPNMDAPFMTESVENLSWKRSRPAVNIIAANEAVRSSSHFMSKKRTTAESSRFFTGK